jgi:hypothetical protein
VKLLTILSNNDCIHYDHIRFDDTSKYINVLLKWIGNRKIKILALSNDGDMIYGERLRNKGLLGLSKYCCHLTSLNINFYVLVLINLITFISRLLFFIINKILAPTMIGFTFHLILLLLPTLIIISNIKILSKLFNIFNTFSV